VLIQNRTEFEKGNPETVFLSLPATKEELYEAMKALNITADNPQDFFLNGYSTDESRRIDIPFDWIRDGDLDKINFLAARLEEMTTGQLEKLDAVMHSDFKPESLDGLIDHTYNTDFYSHIPGIFSYKELGDYFLNDSGRVQMPEQWKAGIDREDFGYNAALHEDGKLTDYGYIARNGTDWKEVYAGQETPEQYRIMGYPEAERTAPEQNEKEAAPATTLDPQAVAAANPSRPIELKSQKPAEKMKEITDKLEAGIQELFDSDRFKEYLQVMSKFHNYSFNNTLLIAMQKPDATLVAGYNSWKNLFGRQVARGAKGIKVLAPSPYKVKKEVDKIDPKTQKPVTDKDGKPVKEEMEITVPAFKVVSVFDVSQTEGKELPSIGVDELTGDVEQYADFFKAAELAAPVPVGFEKIGSGAKGYYSQTDKRIAINEGMSELQNLKTLIHETAHAKLHDIDLNAPPEKQADRPDRNTREVQAESIAYAVCQHYGLDTSDYSFSYVAQWSSGRELSELKASLETIRSTASELIKDIDKNFAELTKDREQEQAQETPENEPTLEEKQPGQAAPQEEKADATEPTADTPQEEKATTKEPAKETMQPEQSEEENFPTPDPNGEPVVTILWSEHSRFHDGETMSLSEANALIGSLDAAVSKEDGYYKTKFRIDFVMDGQPDNYIGRQDLGDGDGTLIEHIEDYHAYYENNSEWDNYILRNEGKEALEADKAQREMLLHEFVPYLKLHDSLSKMEHTATQALQGNEAMTSTETAYHTAMQEYVSQCRTMVNSGNYELPPAPQLKDFDTELEAYKEHVKEEIAQEAAAAGMTVEEYAANGYEPYNTELPDPSISVKDMQEYGYAWDGMLPLKEEAALHLYEKEDMQIFLLHEDGSESIPENAEDIKAHAEKGGIFGVHKEDWNALTEYRAMTQELAGSEATKEMLHEYGAKEQDENTFTIYQLKDDVPADYHFRSLERLQENGLAVDPANYEKIYTAPLAPGMGLEGIYEKFNLDRPEDFKGHSLSVSDVVVLHQNGRDTAHYTDSIGFADVTKDFLLENPLKAAELSTEQNENMIDGVINNTPDTDTARITAAAKSRYDGMTALYTMDDKTYIGKSENYDNKGHYDNTDNSLFYVSGCQAAFTFLSSEGCTYPQDEALTRGIYTKEDYEEFSRIEDFLSQAGFTPEKEFCFDGKPFSLHGDTPEQAAPEKKTVYYTINEGAARRANDANSFSDYKPGSATAEYRQMVDKAVEIAENQKKRVDPMYHEKIDSLVDTYARKLAENMNSSFSIEARVPSVLIAGGSNFPVRKKEKQNAARDRNMEEWNDIQGLLDKIRSTGMGGISADDPQAVQKLEAKLEKLQAAQDTMKAVNAYYRKHKTLDGCPNLSAERIEKMKAEMSSQWHIEDKPYPSWALSNNNAEIRRIKGRIAELTKKQETAYAGWEFDGGRVEANREDNRLQIFFEEKPDEKTRETLKENGFRWSPKAGAWQRQLNDNAIYAADRLSCIRPLSGKSPAEIQKEARTAAKTEKKPSIRAQLAQDKEALKNAPKKAAQKEKKQDLERS
ncbi:MAG: YodL domain-containing protein, partial [Firmicutes bacterium]|nr:YodL domain-containing protein [Bacillota bacterium]